MIMPAHQPTPGLQRQVEALAAYGIPEYEIARVLAIDPKTLRKHYREELDLGATKANAQVAGFLFAAAKSGNVTAQIFWLKTRARWKEPPAEFRHAALVGNVDLSKLSDQELSSLITGAGMEALVDRTGTEPP
jgi:hypothetical protein